MTAQGLDSRHRASLLLVGLTIVVVAIVAFFIIPGIGLILAALGLVLIAVAVVTKAVARPSG
jgi:hypothetical protein